MTEFQGPAILEFILEGAVNIGMGTEINKITEFEDLAQGAADAPTAIALLD
jgi:tartronate-semialdehyde synthase